MRSARQALGFAALLGAALTGACGDRPHDDPLIDLAPKLDPGERLIYIRTLDPTGSSRSPEGVVAVVAQPDDRLELRIYERRGEGSALAHRAAGGDRFLNLDLVDVNGDGRLDLIATWGGGHLTIVDVIGREKGGTYRSLFQNAGREVEIRHGPGGSVGFAITGRTFEEGAGQPPVYETTLYRWDGAAFTVAGP